MLITESHKFNLKKTEIFFANKPKIFHLFGLYQYYNCLSTNNCWGFIKQDKYTKLIDLTNSSDEILSCFNKTTQYQIRRAIRQGTEFEIEPDINAFINFYNGFAESKNISFVKSKDLDHLKNHLFISKAIYEKRCLVMHANIFDPETKRVQMYKSASKFRMYPENRKRSLLGRVNRYLHFMDMKYAKDMNMLIYDFGGYALNTQDEVLENINKFKDGFKGTLQKESNYTSFTLWLLLKFKRVMNI